MSRYDGKTVLVTGAGAGIGRVTAQLFASEGANVVVADVDEAGGAETVSLIEKQGGITLFVLCDVTKLSNCEATAAAAKETYGGIDVAFANAGISAGFGTLLEWSEREIANTIDVDLLGVLFTCRAVIPHLINRGGGSIVLAASAGSLRPGLNMVPYNAAKYGVVGVTQALALELAPQGIRVNAVAPGVVYTDMTARECELAPGLFEYYTSLHPLGHLVEATDVAQAVVFLCSKDALAITGATLPVDCGSVLPQTNRLWFEHLRGGAVKGDAALKQDVS